MRRDEFLGDDLALLWSYPIGSQVSPSSRPRMDRTRSEEKSQREQTWGD